MIEFLPSSVRWLWKWYLAPSSERWRLCWNPSSVRWLLFEWLCAYPSFVRLIFVWLCTLPLSVEVVSVGERSCVLSIVFVPNPQWRFPMWEVLCGRVSGNPSVWRRERRAVCSNLETYLGVYIWSTFSNSLSFTLCIDSYCHIIYMLGLLVFLTCV